ncbi:MAG TPA: ATPase [Persephonella sp.]|nr:ATPase [Hydrogenothermaceae bacterium]HIQ24469.1 ATPase [Persephonella sp.]
MANNRKDKLLKEYIHDPYFTKEKYHDPSVCQQCGVVFHDGIFQWMEKTPANAQKILCPACRRINDKYEGGIVYLKGEFLQNHKDEIMNLIKNTADEEMAYRPLERIIEIKEKNGEITITTTYEHIARRIGEAVHRAYKGALNMQYPEGQKYIRVFWQRD